MVGSSVSTKMIDRQVKVACLVERATPVDGIGRRMYEPTRILSLRKHQADGSTTGAKLSGSGVYCQEWTPAVSTGFGVPDSADRRAFPRGQSRRRWPRAPRGATRASGTAPALLDSRPFECSPEGDR